MSKFEVGTRVVCKGWFNGFHGEVVGDYTEFEEPGYRQVLFDGKDRVSVTIHIDNLTLEEPDTGHIQDIADRMVACGRNHFEYRICSECERYPRECWGYHDGYDPLRCLAGLVRDGRLTVEMLEEWLQEYERDH